MLENLLFIAAMLGFILLIVCIVKQILSLIRKTECPIIQKGFFLSFILIASAELTASKLNFFGRICSMISILAIFIFFYATIVLVYRAFKKRPVKKHAIAAALAFVIALFLPSSPKTDTKVATDSGTKTEQVAQTESTEKTKKEEEKKEQVPPKEENTFQEAVVTQVIDGDTIDVTMNGKTEKIRLIGLDTPEIQHPNKGVEYYGKEASEYTTNQLLNKTVYLQQDVSSTDKFGRLLFYVWLARPRSNSPTEEEIAKNCFNSLLIENGYAKASTYPPDVKYNDFFRTREQIARNNHFGLWGEGGEKQVAETTPAPQPTNDTQQEQQKSTSKKIVLNKAKKQKYTADTTEGKIKGNKKSMIYHCPGQRDYDKISIKNVVYFDTEEQAQAAGYRRAKR